MGTRLYPQTSNPKIIAAIVGASYVNLKQKEIIDQWTKERKGKMFCIELKEDEYIIDEEMDDHGDSIILVEMPDGVILEGNTRYQGEHPNCANGLLWRWIAEYYPKVHEINQFDTFGWGRVEFPDDWKGNLVDWDEDEEDDREYPLGSYYSGGTKDPELIQELLDHMGIQLPDGVTIEDLEGIGWY